ncbi:MAG: hypothetical protein GY875_13360 [Gammaproteobacteria bacterium]|nr:hypothetical protein [Gammaproteobacteria bacterium]
MDIADLDDLIGAGQLQEVESTIAGAICDLLMIYHGNLFWDQIPIRMSQFIKYNLETPIYLMKTIINRNYIPILSINSVKLFCFRGLYLIVS